MLVKPDGLEALEVRDLLIEKCASCVCQRFQIIHDAHASTRTSKRSLTFETMPEDMLG
jgi:hypothetical protein